MSSKDHQNRRWGLFTILLEILLLFIGWVSVLYTAYYHVESSIFKCSSITKFERRPTQGRILEYFLPSSEELVRSEKSFEQEVLSEVRRVCAEVYPDLDPDYVSAIIWAESRFQPDAVNNRTGATGLMQILPKWHTLRADRLGVSLNEWKGNILVGCDILNEMIQKKGSMHYAVNFYAGGYNYADYYERTGELSPYENSLNNILSSEVFEEMEVM